MMCLFFGMTSLYKRMLLVCKKENVAGHLPPLKEFFGRGHYFACPPSLWQAIKKVMRFFTLFPPEVMKGPASVASPGMS